MIRLNPPLPENISQCCDSCGFFAIDGAPLKTICIKCELSKHTFPYWMPALKNCWTCQYFSEEEYDEGGCNKDPVPVETNADRICSFWQLTRVLFSEVPYKMTKVQLKNQVQSMDTIKEAIIGKQ